MDDVDWKDVSRETKLSIFDKDEYGQVRVLYDCVTVPSDIIKVVISNFDKHIDNILNVPDQNYIESQEAAASIRRRITKIVLKESLIITNSNAIYKCFYSVFWCYKIKINLYNII